jgi:hypothetical protein
VAEATAAKTTPAVAEAEEGAAARNRSNHYFIFSKK